MPEAKSNDSPPSSAFLSNGAACGAVVFALALLLRLLGIDWGLPNEQRWTSLHPDEPIVLGYSQAIDIAQGRFDPGFYNYGTLYLTVLNVATRVVDGYGGGMKAADSPEEEWKVVSRYHLAGRVVSALAGAGLAWVCLLVLFRRTHVFGAYAAALAVAFSPGLVVHSRFQTVDMLAAFLTLLSVYYALKLLPPDGRDVRHVRVASWSGLFAGLAGGTKYSGLLALLALFVALGWVPKPARWWSLISALAAGLVGFFVATPGALLNPAAFWRDFRYEMVHTSTGHGLVFAATPSGFIVQIGNLIASMGGLLLLLGACGLAWTLWRRTPWAVALLAFGLATYVLIGRAEVKFLRYAFPLVPVVAVGFGYLMGESHAHVSKKMRIWVLAGLLALGGFGGGGLSGSAVATLQMLAEDPRDAAGQYLKSVGSGLTVGVVRDPWFQTPTLYPGTALPRAVPEDVRMRLMAEARDPAVVQYRPADGEPKHEWDKRLVSDLAPDYIVYSSFESDDVERIAESPRRATPAEREEAERYRAFMESLQAGYEPDKAFGLDGPSVHDLMYIRPRIWVWKRKTGLTTPSSGSSTTSGSNEGPANTP